MVPLLQADPSNVQEADEMYYRCRSRWYGEEEKSEYPRKKHPTCLRHIA